MGYILDLQKTDALPTGEYDAAIETVELTDGTYGEQLRFTFRLTGPLQNGREIWGWTTTKYTKRSKLGHWVSAALQSADLPEQLDTDALIGQMVTLSLLKRRKDDGEFVNKIDSVLPFAGDNVAF